MSPPDEKRKPSDAAAQRRASKTPSKKKRRFRGVPAPYVFYPLALLAVASMGAVYVLGTSFLAFSGAVSVLTLYALYVNDSKGFVRRRQMRRAFEARRHFDNWEVAVLVLLVMGNVLASALALLS